MERDAVCRTRARHARRHPRHPELCASFAGEQPSLILLETRVLCASLICTVESFGKRTRMRLEIFVQIAVDVEQQTAELPHDTLMLKIAAVLAPPIDEMAPARLHVHRQRDALLPIVAFASRAVRQQPIEVHVCAERLKDVRRNETVVVVFAGGCVARRSGREATKHAGIFDRHCFGVTSVGVGAGHGSFSDGGGNRHGELRWPCGRTDSRALASKNCHARMFRLVAAECRARTDSGRSAKTKNHCPLSRRSGKACTRTSWRTPRMKVSQPIAPTGCIGMLCTARAVWSSIGG